MIVLLVLPVDWLLVPLIAHASSFMHWVSATGSICFIVLLTQSTFPFIPETDCFFSSQRLPLFPCCSLKASLTHTERSLVFLEKSHLASGQVVVVPLSKMEECPVKRLEAPLLVPFPLLACKETAFVPFEVLINRALSWKQCLGLAHIQTALTLFLNFRRPQLWGT